MIFENIEKQNSFIFGLMPPERETIRVLQLQRALISILIASM